MSTELENGLVTELSEMFSKAGISAAVEDFNGKKVLVIDYGEDNIPEDCNISTEQLTEDCRVMFIMFTVASGLDAKQSHDVLDLLPYLNKYLTVGSFGITEKDGYFYFSCSLVIDEETDRNVLLKTATHTLDIAAATVEEAADLIAPVLSGETSAAELMNEDISIVQI